MSTNSQVFRPCPQCGGNSELYLSIIFKNSEIPDPKIDWKLRCECGFERKGRFSRTTTFVATLIYLAPIAILWGVFLIYSEKIHPAGLNFFVWLLHIGPGVLAGDKLSRHFAVRDVLSQIRKNGQ